jgi:succinate dehydrogenase/fumarate reductase flavoprotein subunit
VARAAQEQRIETDVLVIGGGLAGCFAAMKAAAQGVRVAVAEKGHVAHSSSNTTGIDHYPYCYIPEVHGRLGYTVEGFVKNHTVVGRGTVDQELCEMMWQDSYERLLELESIGIKVRFEKIYPWNFGFAPGDYPEDPKFRIVPWPGFTVPPALNIEGRHIKAKLNTRLRELGVNLLHFHNVQDLLTRDGAIAGAAGFNIRTGDFFVVEAKAVVLASGSLCRLFPSGVLFNHLVPPNQTAEGQTMALRAGAELAVQEQYLRSGLRVLIGMARLRNWIRSAPATPSGYPSGRVVNAKGEVMPNKNRDIDQSFEDAFGDRQAEWIKASIKEGKTPFYWDATAATEEERNYTNWSCAEEGGGIELYRHLQEDLKADFSTHQIELARPRIYEQGQAVGFLLTSPSGLVIDTKAESTIEGLFAAGEVAYGQHFPSSPWAFATGARAGNGAAKRALGVAKPSIDRGQVATAKQRILSPLNQERGTTWPDMNRGIHNVMQNYFMGASPNAKRIGIEKIEALKHEPLQAANPHELMRTMETASLLAVAEIFLRASFAPRKPNEWRLLRQADGEMSFTTRPIQYKYPFNHQAMGKGRKEG